MKIAVASDDGRAIASHTGRSRGFLIYTLNDGAAPECEFRPNTFTAHARGQCNGTHEHGSHQHGHGAIIAALSDCQALVARGMGWRLLDDLDRAGLQVYITACECADEAIRLYQAGQLDHNRTAVCHHQRHH